MVCSDYKRVCQDLKFDEWILDDAAQRFYGYLRCFGGNVHPMAMRFLLFEKSTEEYDYLRLSSKSLDGEKEIPEKDLCPFLEKVFVGEGSKENIEEKYMAVRQHLFDNVLHQLRHADKMYMHAQVDTLNHFAMNWKGVVMVKKKMEEDFEDYRVEADWNNSSMSIKVRIKNGSNFELYDCELGDDTGTKWQALSSLKDRTLRIRGIKEGEGDLKSYIFIEVDILHALCMPYKTQKPSYKPFTPYFDLENNKFWMGDKAGNATPPITIGPCGWDDVGVDYVPDNFHRWVGDAKAYLRLSKPFPVSIRNKKDKARIGRANTFRPNVIYFDGGAEEYWMSNIKTVYCRDLYLKFDNDYVYLDEKDYKSLKKKIGR